MPECTEQIYSNDYLDFIIAKDAAETAAAPPGCVMELNEVYDAYFYPGNRYPDFNLPALAYDSIPKCFGLLDEAALAASGILKLQEQPALSLKGQGVMIGFLDTGIDYRNPAFCFSDGSSRILRIWDMTARDGTAPKGFSFGAEYTRERINEALISENPLSVVPETDENGHGTFVAGVACGSEDVKNGFTGAAPYAQIAFVKLKEAKRYLKDFYFIPEGTPAYQENDVMLALRYLDGLAKAQNLPLVICLALGSNMGNRGGDGPVTSYLDAICERRKRCVVAAVGNEANARHHFRGNLLPDMEYEAAEISVESDVPGFFLELWAKAPELYAVSVTSPTGEVLPKVPYRSGFRQEVTFVFEQTTVSIDYRTVGRQEGNELVYVRFLNARAGIWTVNVYPQGVLSGTYHMWLPMRGFSAGNIIFLRSDPEQTLTVPGNARQPIGVGGYHAGNGGLYTDSGRGYTLSGAVKPDFCAPAVDIYGPQAQNRFVTRTGTSAAAAITAGACAQIMEWGIVRQSQPYLTSADIKNMLIRGANRENDRIYPNNAWGYGTLDVYAAFENLRGQSF